MNQLVPVHANGQEFRQSTDAAGLCGAIVKQTARNIQGRRYVTVEGWQAIAIAHGCTASADHVERVNDEGMAGFKCVGVVKRMSDGAEIARAEGFLGDDENVWNKRPVYARRAMVQTRAISRACRSAFAHVVVMIDAGLSTTPAEEVPEGGFVEGDYEEVRKDRPNEPRGTSGGNSEQRQMDSAGPASNTRDLPFPQGPAKNKTELKTLARAFWREIEGCGDDIELSCLLGADENVKLVAQVKDVLPAWWDGYERDGEVHDGLVDVISRKEKEFTAAALARPE